MMPRCTIARARVPKQHWLFVAGVALVCAAQLFRAHFRLSIVSGNSMLPTLCSGDFLLVDRRAYQNAEQQNAPRRPWQLPLERTHLYTTQKQEGIDGDSHTIRC